MGKINWGQSLIAAVISVAVTVIGGFILFKLQEQSPDLSYFSEKIPPFKGNKETYNINHITISNNGSQLVEKVEATIETFPAKINKINTSPILDKNNIKIIDSQKIKIELPYLNPSSKLIVSFISQSKDSTENSPKINLIAKGVNGKPESRDEVSPKSSETYLKYAILLATFAAGLAVVLRGYLKSKYSQEDLDNEEEIEHNDQRDVFNYIYRNNNLASAADLIYTLEKKTTYWSEADRITFETILNNNSNTAENVISALEQLLSFAKIADSSQAIIHLNIAKLKKTFKPNSNYIKNLTEAKNKDPKVVALRLKLDKVLELGDLPTE